ncbi:MAG: hypothetical protein OES38_21490, partial [Gammaproteobacteria bacterium]|nr:hypothetical protein [Gammaproteobacteria bacterium]
MFIQDKARSRSVHLGPYPLETLPRDPSVLDQELRRPLANYSPLVESEVKLARVVARYVSLFLEYRDGAVAAALAPVPDDVDRRAMDIKGLGYFLDADHLGICRLPAGARFVEADQLSQSTAVVVVVAHQRLPEQDNLAYQWLLGAEHQVAEMRAGEIAVSLAGYIRQLGFPATAHVASATGVDLDRLAVPAGVAVREGAGLVSPYLGADFSIAAVTTDYELALDEPLAAKYGKVTGRRYNKGVNGAVSGRERVRRR